MDKNNIFVKISVDELKKLLIDSAKLVALENGGVDNWVWYSDSLKDLADLLGYESFEEYIKIFDKHILENYELIN